VVIPKNIRDTLQLHPGQKMKIMGYNGRIELIPDRDISELKGFLKGINTDFIREDDRL
jgi:AbrB family looped-hinge helix DNA binding protein